MYTMGYDFRCIQRSAMEQGDKDEILGVREIPSFAQLYTDEWLKNRRGATRITLNASAGSDFDNERDATCHINSSSDIERADTSCCCSPHFRHHGSIPN